MKALSSSPRDARRASRALLCLCASLALAGSMGAFACWPDAPSGGTLDGGKVAPVSEGGTPTEDAGGKQGDATSSEAGEGGSGFLPDGAPADATPVVLPQPSTTLAEGVGFACAIDPTGNVWCWGRNDFGQAGAQPSPGAPVAHPNQVAGVASAVAIALGDYHACAVTSTNAVYCWGLDDSGQLAHADDAGGDDICVGANPKAGVPCLPTATLANVPAAASIAAAGGWTCIVGTDKTVTCWGAIQTGQTVSGAVSCPLGPAAEAGSCYPAPYAVGVSGVTQLAVGYDHACAISPGDGGGQITCWGNNAEGQVRPTGCSCDPVTSAFPLSKSVGAGIGFTCALIDDGGLVSCAGDNNYGELGQPPDANAPFDPYPALVSGLGPVAELVTAGNAAACALIDGGVSCWGNVAVGAASPGVPVGIPGLPSMLSLGVADDSYACGGTADGGIWCWYLVDGGGATLVQ